MSTLPTERKRRPVTASSRAEVPTENTGASAGASVAVENPLITLASGQKVRALSPSTQSLKPIRDDSGIETVEQALAIAWPGLEWLARNSQLILCNDKKTGIGWAGFKGIKITANGLALADKDTE